MMTIIYYIINYKYILHYKRDLASITTEFFITEGGLLCRKNQEQKARTYRLKIVCKMLFK